LYGPSTTLHRHRSSEELVDQGVEAKLVVVCCIVPAAVQIVVSEFVAVLGG